MKSIKFKHIKMYVSFPYNRDFGKYYFIVHLTQIGSQQHVYCSIIGLQVIEKDSRTNIYVK